MKKINEYLLQARKEKNSDKIKFYSTFKGEIESELKRSNKSEDLVIEEVAKKWDKNLKTLNTEQSKFELELLKEFLPQGLSESQMTDIYSQIKEENQDLFTEYFGGNDKLSGRIIGLLMKASNGQGNVEFFKTLL